MGRSATPVDDNVCACPVAEKDTPTWARSTGAAAAPVSIKIESAPAEPASTNRRIHPGCFTIALLGPEA